MFFKPVKWEQKTPVTLNTTLCLSGIDGYPAQLLTKAAQNHGQEGGISIISAVQTTSIPEEAYELQITENQITILFSQQRGLIYGAVTVMQMAEFHELYTGTLFDEPDCQFRGYRIYLPGRKSFEDFYALVDFLVYYKYNYLSLEIGGAMEYKKHPEINAAWQEFAMETHKYSGRAHEIQNGYDWSKNSIHTDNAEGDILTQDEVRMLISYCEERGLIVYPETPFLSHSDYICLAHPEFAERKEDPYPDTYCPSNPNVYEIVFDILDEVIDVFHPTMINIGHDEFYSMCLCEECSKKRPEQVFAEDIIRIHDYLAERGIRTAMWGEKLLPLVLKDQVYGGADIHRVSSNGTPYFIPGTYLVQQLLPRDILMIHWYYCFGMQYDFVYHSQGYEAIYGNMTGSIVEHWRLRRNFGIQGGSCSNWGSNAPEYMQRNGQYRSLIFGAYALWSKEYDSVMRNELLWKTFHEAFRYHYGDLEQTPYIVVTHTTDRYVPFKVFYDGVFITGDYIMGNYVATYADGTKHRFEVKYGSNIASHTLPMTSFGNDAVKDPEVPETSALEELCYSAIPSMEDGKTWYTTAFVNPCPEKDIVSFEYEPIRSEKVETKAVRFTCKNT